MKIYLPEIDFFSPGRFLKNNLLKNKVLVYCIRYIHVYSVQEMFIRVRVLVANVFVAFINISFTTNSHLIKN